MNPAFGHGLGGETHPPVLIGDRDAVLSIDVSPSMFDPSNPENYVTLRLFDSKEGYEIIIEHVTFILELKKDGERIFRYMFHDEFGNLTFRVISNNLESIDIKGLQEPLLGGWMRNGTESLTLTGPIFSSGGLYEYKVEVLTVDYDNKILDQRIELEGAISLAETIPFEAIDSQNQSHQLQVISYFDTPNNIKFDSSNLTFSMPFDWNQNLEQISVVHQEVRIPQTFDEFLSANYKSYVNGILLSDDIVTVDDYSSDEKTVHMVLNRDMIKQIKDDAVSISNSQIDFRLQKSDKTQSDLIIEPSDVEFPSKAMSNEIPSWIKNNAGWWADDQIDDETFVQGIQHLIKQNILQIPTTTSQESDSNEIPSWIKNNAGWWADDQIDDETFVQGIQFLIRQGIIVT